MSLLLAAKKHSGAKVANYLWKLLPDSDQTLQKWGQIYGVSPNSAFALLSKVGEDCAGAIQIVTDEWMAANADSAGGFSGRRGRGREPPQAPARGDGTAR
ncbi:HipA N-terminal domain-containing protein [Bradyrhizobium zhanjiangense]|uniref:HipA N-terminal domain-containing protein n=1 Tax=Bradyrhizobium zhanjiangense TaxID=1325107 RepID=UPI0013E8DAD8|nr:HipA N-terminal domain-containing protein [Bradyrhizobium zhanjiangense]